MSYSAAIIICSLLCGIMMPQAVVLAASSHVTGGGSATTEVHPVIKSNPFLVNPFLVNPFVVNPFLATRHHDIVRSRDADLTRVYEIRNSRRRERNQDHALRKDHSRWSREAWGENDSEGGDRLPKASQSSTPAPLWPDTSVNNAIPAVPRGDPDDAGQPKSTTPADAGADLLKSAHGSVDSNEITETGGGGLSSNVSGASHAGADVQRDSADVQVDGRVAGDDRSRVSTAQASGDVTAAIYQDTKGKDGNITEDDSSTPTGHSNTVQNAAAPSTGQHTDQHAAAPPLGESPVQDAELTPVLNTATSTKHVTAPMPRVKKPKVHKPPGDIPHARTPLKVNGGNYSATKLSLTLQSQDDSVTALWTFESNDTGITGFLVTYRINNREHYDSSKLGKLVRSFTLHSLHEDEDYVICVHAMVNTTAVVDACAHWNEASMKMVVGIMAGTLFLVPCIIVVVWILVKDSQIRSRMSKGVETSGAGYSKRLIAHGGSHHDDGHSPKRHGGSHPCHATHSDLEVSGHKVDGAPLTPNGKGLPRGASSSPKCNHPHHAVSGAELLDAESLVPPSLRPQPKTSKHSPAQAESHSSPRCQRDHVVLSCHANHGTPASSVIQDTAGTKKTGGSHSSEDLPGSTSVLGLNKQEDSRRLSEPWFGLLDNEAVVHLDHQRAGQGASYLHIPPVLFDDNDLVKGQDGDIVAPL